MDRVRLYRRQKTLKNSHEKTTGGRLDISRLFQFHFCSYPYLSGVCRGIYSQGYFGRSFGKA